MPLDTEEISRVLRRSRLSSAKSCTPCRLRKVKCNTQRPCQTCRRRGHPQICVYNAGSVEGRRSSRSSPSSQTLEAPRSPSLGGDASSVPTAASNASLYSRSGRPAAPAQSLSTEFASVVGDGSNIAGGPNDTEGLVTARDDQATAQNRYEGNSSVLSIFHENSQEKLGALRGDVGSALGLANTLPCYPFMDSETPQEQWALLMKIVPRQDEVLRFLPTYCSSAYAFNPILADIDEFQNNVGKYLAAWESGELQNPNQVSERWLDPNSVAYIALLLATLSSGAHFSMLEPSAELECCIDFARRSFQALRLANFLFRPSLDIIQALLVIVNTLQNIGQSDGAWAFLGTTVRLAQSLGLHSNHFGRKLGDKGAKARSVWTATAWQDANLSICHGRPPIASNLGMISIDDPAHLPDEQFSYAEVMHGLISVCLRITNMEGRPDLDHCVTLVAETDRYYSKAPLRLRSRQDCKTFQGTLEYLALRIHMSFCVSVVCRPALRSLAVPGGDSRMVFLLQRIKQSMIDISEAFLEFQALSVIPLRTWSMVHSVLSSTLLFSLLDDTRDDPQCRNLQQRVLAAFSKAAQQRVSKTAQYGGSNTTVDNHSSRNIQWLSDRHIRALVAVQNAIQKVSATPRESSKETQNAPPRPDGYTGPTMPMDLSNNRTDTDPYFDFSAMLGNQPTVPLQYNMDFDSIENPLDWNTFSDYDATSDLSPLSRLDTIMNAPLQDFSQYSSLFEA